MVEDIVREAVGALNAAFPEARVYTEHMPQGFDAPAFFIEAASPKVRGELDDRYVMTLPISVRYYCGEDGDDKRRAEASETAMGLYAVLEYIGDERKLRGMNMGHSLGKDGALRFDVTYRVRFIRRRDDALMGAVDIGMGVRD